MNNQLYFNQVMMGDQIGSPTSPNFSHKLGKSSINPSEPGLYLTDSQE